jgi:L-asparagine transporter-like permease
VSMFIAHIDAAAAACCHVIIILFTRPCLPALDNNGCASRAMCSLKMENPLHAHRVCRLLLSFGGSFEYEMRQKLYVLISTAAAARLLPIYLCHQINALASHAFIMMNDEMNKRSLASPPLCLLLSACLCAALAILLIKRTPLARSLAEANSECVLRVL